MSPELRPSLGYLKKLEAKTKRRILEAVEGLPEKGDIKRMKGRNIQNIFRLRVGSYRVIFVREEEVIKVLEIAPRGQASR